MKKLLSVILALVMCLTLCACADGDGGKANDAKSGITFDKTELTMLKGATESLAVVFGEEYSGEKKATWSAANADMLEIKDDTRGDYVYAQVKAKTTGATTITAVTPNKKKATIDVKVVEKMELTATHLTVMQTETINFPLPSYEGVTFRSENANVATVSDSGVITGIAKGTTNILATNGAQDWKISVEVTRLSLPIKQYAITLETGASVDFPLDDLSGVMLTANNPTIANIENGKIVAVAAGTATVTATKGDFSETVTVTVMDALVSELVLSATKSDLLNYYGRTVFNAQKGEMFYNTASGLDISFYGTELKVTLNVVKVSKEIAISLYVDNESMVEATTTGGRNLTISANQTNKEYTLVSGLTEGYHTVKLRKRTAYQGGTSVFGYFGVTKVKTDGYLTKPAKKSDIRIDFYGDSITSGYGNQSAGANEDTINSDGNMTYATIAANTLGYDYNVLCNSGWGIAYRGSGDPNCALPDHYNKVHVGGETYADGASGADIIVINLGTNDAAAIQGSLMGANVNGFKAKYTEFLTNLRAANPNAYIVCSYGMMGDNLAVSNAITQVVTAFNDNKVSTLFY